jgi:hypothetical protein
VFLLVCACVLLGFPFLPARRRGRRRVLVSALQLVVGSLEVQECEKVGSDLVGLHHDLLRGHSV